MIKNPCHNRAYRVKDQQDTLSMYGDQATTCEQTMKDYEYQSPRQIVEAILRHYVDKYFVVFDASCGTDLSDTAPDKAGIIQID